MLKRSKSKSNSSNSRIKKKLKNKRSDSLCAHCTSIDRGDIADNTSSKDDYVIDECRCKCYFEEKKLIHINSIQNININDYLVSRNQINIKLSSLHNNEEEEDCIINFDSEKNSIKINNTLIDTENIIISKYISNGCYGVILVSSQINSIIYVIKLIIYNDKNINEIKIMTDIKINNNTKIPNFINIVYYHLKCKKIVNSGSNELLEGVSICLNNSEYTMLILEYFDGDVYNLITSLKDKKMENYELIKNIFSQLLLSIYLLHNKFQYCHNDAHLKNFLYKKVNENINECFHYKISNNDYYIKNYGYVIVLSDYGLSTPIIEENKNTSNDYYKILFEIKNIFDICDKCYKKFEEYLLLSCNNNKFDDELTFIDFIMNKILNITNTPCTNIINKIPYT